MSVDYAWILPDSFGYSLILNKMFLMIYIDDDTKPKIQIFKQV